MNRDLETIFRCNDQSALIHNFVASDDPPPGAWGHHSQPQSPLGRLSFPEVLTIARGLVYTMGKHGQVVEHALTSHEWLPWSYRGRGPDIRVERTVSKDVWLAQVRTRRPQTALLLIECHPGNGIKLDFQRITRGVRFRWGHGFAVALTFTGQPTAIDLSDDPAPLKRKFAGFADVKLKDAHCRWAWSVGKSLWVSCRFRSRLEVRFDVHRTARGAVRSISFAAARRAEQRRWEKFFAEQVPALQSDDPVLRDTYYFAWQTLWANRCDGGVNLLKHPFTSPARLSYGSQWWWDEASHAVIYRHLNDPQLAYDGFKNFWALQSADGAIPGNLLFTVNPEQPAESMGRSLTEPVIQSMPMQPPTIGLTLQLLKQKPGWPRNLRPMYEALLRLAHWHLSPKRDTDQDGLAEYHHCFDTSGDQSQRWDSQKLDPNKVIDALKPTESVDYNVWMSLLWQVLAEMAEQLGERSAAIQHAERAKRTVEKIERLMWDERDGFYYDIDGRSHRKIRVKTPSGFMPLLSPFFSPERTERLVRKHLLNPKEFWCKFPLPSVSLDHPKFDPIDMWRGPTWVNVNWMVVEGLSRRGYTREAVRLARKTVELVGPRYSNGRRTRSPRVWEWYHPVTGEALGNSQYSWSALVVDLILRNAFHQMP